MKKIKPILFIIFFIIIQSCGAQDIDKKIESIIELNSLSFDYPLEETKAFLGMPDWEGYIEGYYALIYDFKTIYFEGSNDLSEVVKLELFINSDFVDKNNMIKELNESLEAIKSSMTEDLVGNDLFGTGVLDEYNTEKYKIGRFISVDNFEMIYFLKN